MNAANPVTLLFLLTASLSAQQLSPEVATRVVTTAAQEIERGYVFPDLGRAMADTLRARLARGAYAGILDRTALAQRITTDLRELSNDRHIGVRVPSQPSASGGGPQRGASVANLLPDSLGYLKVAVFDGDLHSRLPDLMSRVVAAKALIIDIRDCPGGGAEPMLSLAGHLLPERTRLARLYSREDNSTTEMWTEEPRGPRFVGRPVYVLTNRVTFSAAEAFAYHLQAIGRVTVVGDTTGGGAHRVRGVDLGAEMFLALPYTRVMNAVTGTDWEGRGVIPDVFAPPGDALDAARRAAQRAAPGTPPR